MPWRDLGDWPTTDDGRPFITSEAQVRTPLACAAAVIAATCAPATVERIERSALAIADSIADTQPVVATFLDSFIEYLRTAKSA